MVTGENVTLCNDGKYRWVYDMNLYTNPTILLVVLKIFFWIIVGTWLFISLVTCCTSRHVWDDVCDFTWVFALIGVGFLAFCTMCYYLFALFVGGKYCVLFEMDEGGVMHKQMPYNTKKSKVIGYVTALAGVATGKAAMVGSGLHVAAKTQQHSDFKRVRSIEVYRRRNVIKVNSPFNYNQVYARDEDFDFVLEFIKSHIPAKAIVK